MLSKHIRNSSINSILMCLSNQNTAAPDTPICKLSYLEFLFKVSQQFMILAKGEKKTIYYYNKFVNSFNVVLILLLMKWLKLFTKYHITNKCTNRILCISLKLFTLNHFKTLSLLLYVSIAFHLSSSGSTYSS